MALPLFEQNTSWFYWLKRHTQWRIQGGGGPGGPDPPPPPFGPRCRLFNIGPKVGPPLGPPPPFFACRPKSRWTPPFQKSWIRPWYTHARYIHSCHYQEKCVEVCLITYTSLLHLLNLFSIIQYNYTRCRVHVHNFSCFFFVICYTYMFQSVFFHLSRYKFFLYLRTRRQPEVSAVGFPSFRVCCIKVCP